jgi:hypothetical protein
MAEQEKKSKERQAQKIGGSFVLVRLLVPKCYARANPQKFAICTANHKGTEISASEFLVAFLCRFGADC